MLRLFGFLLLALVGAGGILFLDFNRTVQRATAADDPPPSFWAYLDTVPGKVASMTRSVPRSAAVLPLADMLPRAPEGWTARPVDPKDIAGFLPKKEGDGDQASIDLVKATGGSKGPQDAVVAVQAYEKGERRVVVQLIRHPDRIFTGPDSIDQRHALRMWAADQRGRAYLTVRGLDVTEEFLGDGMRARLFSASVGAQIQVRMLASKRLKDADLLPFFETLDVQAMNMAVVDPEPGLGEVPVIALAYAMRDTDREAYEADRADRSSAAKQQANAERDAALEELAALDTGTADGADRATTLPKPGLVGDCKTEAGGIKRCSITPDG